MQNINLPNIQNEGEKKWKTMAVDAWQSTDANAPILIISRKEERSDSEGAILTAGKDGRKTVGIE